MERTDEVIEVIRGLRTARIEAVKAASAGHLGVVFDAPADAPSGFTYLVKLLDVHPALGKVKGRRLMSDLGLGQFVRVCELSRSDKDRLLAACGGPS